MVVAGIRERKVGTANIYSIPTRFKLYANLSALLPKRFAILISFGRLENTGSERQSNFSKIKELVSAKVNAYLPSKSKRSP